MNTLSFAAVFVPSADSVAQAVPPHMAALEAMRRPISALVQGTVTGQIPMDTETTSKQKPPSTHRPDSPTFCPDMYEPDNEIGEAQQGTVNGLDDVHTFHVDGDEDWAKLNFRESDTCTITTAGWWDTDTVITLVGSDQTTLLAENDDYPGMVLSSRIDWQVTHTGPHYLRVRDFYGRGECLGYNLRVRCNAPQRMFLPLVFRTDFPPYPDTSNWAPSHGLLEAGTTLTDYAGWTSSSYGSVYSGSDTALPVFAGQGSQ